MSSDFNHRQIWAIALPMVISNITVPLLGLVDTFVVGHLSSDNYLAAIAVGATIFSILFLGFNFLRMGTTGLTAQAYGAGDHEETRRALLRGLVIALGIAAALIILQKPILQLALKLLGPDQIVADIAADYFNIRIFAAPASLMNIVFIGWFIGLQNARTPLVLMLIINVINIVLDIVFVMQLGMKADGVALASVIAEYTGCIAGFFIALQHLRQSRMPALFEGIWNTEKFLELFHVNLDLLIRTMSLLFAFGFLTAIGARQGSAILAANAVLLNFQHITAYALDGFANAAEALVGRAVGARNYSSLIQAVRLSRYWSVIVAMGFVVLYLITGKLIIFAVTDLDHIRSLAMVFLPYLIISPIISVWSFLYDGVFVGTVRSREMRNIMLISTFLVFIPVWLLLQNLGNHGLWLAFSVFMAARGLLMHFRWRKIVDEYRIFLN